jgi:hypothetical protein
MSNEWTKYGEPRLYGNGDIDLFENDINFLKSEVENMKMRSKSGDNLSACQTCTSMINVWAKYDDSSLSCKLIEKLT